MHRRPKSSAATEKAPVVLDERGRVVYPSGCSPQYVSGNNYVIRTSFDVGTRRTQDPGTCFSVFRRCVAPPPLERLDVGKAMAEWCPEQFCEGHVGARIRFPGCMLVICPNFDFTVNGVRDMRVAAMYMWLMAEFLQRKTGLNLRPCKVRIPNRAVSSDLFHTIDIDRLLVDEPNLWRPPGEFSGITRRLPPPDNRTIILYRTGFMILTGPTQDAVVDLADFVRISMEKYYISRNMTSVRKRRKVLADLVEDAC